MRMLVLDERGELLGSVAFSGWGKNPLKPGSRWRFPLANWRWTTADFTARRAVVNGQEEVCLMREKNWTWIDEYLDNVPELSEIESWKGRAETLYLRAMRGK